ncbi:hypothetical protein ACH5RR_008176 [Cinchona calisaya]|uniref:MAPK kinase substrate protein n=1 Tax=Cinchona calisaya TaxID=153742 RepID=A0ABD3AAV0_9GENT
MAGLQRSAVSFRRQGSSGLVWDDKLLSTELNHQPEQPINQREDQPPQQEVQEEVAARGTVGSIERSRSNGGEPRYRTGRVSPAVEPPSPKVSACGFCTCKAFGKQPEKEKTRRRPPNHAGKRAM